MRRQLEFFTPHIRPPLPREEVVLELPVPAPVADRSSGRPASDRVEKIRETELVPDSLPGDELVPDAYGGFTL